MSMSSLSISSSRACMGSLSSSFSLLSSFSFFSSAGFSPAFGSGFGAGAAFDSAPAALDIAAVCCAACLLTGSWKSTCLICQACRSFCHCVHLPLNQSEGFTSSTRVQSFRLFTQSLRNWPHWSAFDHVYLISSKPSLSAGRLNLSRLPPMTVALRSGVKNVLNLTSFSAAVSVTTSAFSLSSSMFSSSEDASSSFTFASSFTSSSFFSSVSPSSAFFFASSSFFFAISAFFFAFFTSLSFIFSSFFLCLFASKTLFAFCCLLASLASRTLLV
mmetsp:Transcript_17735/g.28851  ORF Transcript_17735/g.28851 Transcript_17735/m.28851 type:complete len:273 (+) Transcript_17735:1078-1896(+)